MTRQRVRPVHSAEELSQIYAKPHNHFSCIDHRVRVAMTMVVAQTVDAGATSGADLSCGDGTILRNLNLGERYFGDFAPGYPIHGPIEQTLDRIPEVDIYVCTETLEHLDDPDTVLKRLRSKTKALVISTPVDNWDDNNLEHYWAWSRQDVEDMLVSAGFRVVVFTGLDLRPAGGYYCFGIWSCL